MECDSMHLLIVRRQENQKIYSSNEYALLFECARFKPWPYIVKQIGYTDFFDFVQVSKTFVHNRTIDVHRECVKWLLINMFQFRCGIPNYFYFKFNVADPEFNSVHVSKLVPKKPTPGKRPYKPKAAPPTPILHSTPYILKTIYLFCKPISLTKKRDLVMLVHKKIIPEAYSHFYLNLQTDTAVQDIIMYNLSDNEKDENL